MKFRRENRSLLRGKVSQLHKPLEIPQERIFQIEITFFPLWTWLLLFNILLSPPIANFHFGFSVEHLQIFLDSVPMKKLRYRGEVTQPGSTQPICRLHYSCGPIKSLSSYYQWDSHSQNDFAPDRNRSFIKAFLKCNIHIEKGIYICV